MEAFFSSELIAILAGVLSIILAVIAIGLSVHFYNQGKAAEKSVAVALASIEAQATILSRITEKHMGQLISSVTDTTMIEKVMDTWSKLPAKHSLSADPSLPAPTATAPNPDMIIDSYKLLFYAFMVNLSLQSMFPDPIKDVPKHVRDTLDESERDFWSSLTAIKRRESQWEGTERATWESFKKVSGHVRNSSQFMNRFLE